MSMYDRCYCASKCIRKNCERNLGYHKTHSRIYTVSYLDSECTDDKHIRCTYFSAIDEENFDE